MSPPSFALLFLALFVWLGQALVAAYAAHSAGRDAVRWALLALVLGPPALFAVLLLPHAAGAVARRQLELEDVLARLRADAARQEEERREAAHRKAVALGSAELLERERQRLARRQSR